MKDNNLLKLGGIVAIVLGLVKALNSILYLILPVDLRAEIPGKVFLPAFAANPDPLMAIFWSEALVGLLGIAIVPAVSSLVRGKKEGWLSWSSNLAMIGYAVSNVGYLLSIARLPTIAKAYVAGDASTQAALAATWKSSIDLLGFWGYAAIGFWILVVSILALQNATFPKWLGWVGIAASIPHLLIPIGTYFKTQEILLGVVVIALVLLPAWYIGIGLHMRKAANT